MIDPSVCVAGVIEYWYDPHSSMGNCDETDLYDTQFAMHAASDWAPRVNVMRRVDEHIIPSAAVALWSELQGASISSSSGSQGAPRKLASLSIFRNRFLVPPPS
jgi:hypothetical protein